MKVVGVLFFDGTAMIVNLYTGTTHRKCYAASIKISASVADPPQCARWSLGLMKRNGCDRGVLRVSRRFSSGTRSASREQ